MLDANRKIPDSVTEVIEDTTLERWYNKLRLRYLSDIRFEDTDISFTLLLPPGTRMKEKK
jgi:hypothetical protein